MQRPLELIHGRRALVRVHRQAVQQGGI